MRKPATLTTAVGACLLGLVAAIAVTQGAPGEPSYHQVSVIVDGQFYDIPTSAETVGGVLDFLGVSLGPLDRTDPAPDARLTTGTTIRVTRVTCQDTFRERAVAPRTIVLADRDRPVGYTKILRHGSKGILRETVRVWKKEGGETLRKVIGEEFVEQPEDAVVVRGARGASSRGGDWRRPLVMEATAYDPGPRSCGRWATGFTATGVPAERGVVAVDDRVIPLGTQLYIPGYGFAVAADRGGAIRGRRIDLCFPTYEEAIEFGRQDVKVYVLD